MKIPYNKIFYSGKEIEYVKDAIKREQINADGHYTKLVSDFLEDKLGIEKILMTTSGTHALEMASMLIDLKCEDEVIMPSFTFPSTANAVMIHGAKPVFADIKNDTLNIDPKDIEAKITKKTKAIIPVHYGGVGCEMDIIMDIAKRYNLFVIEDAAQGVNAKYKEKFLGSWGHIGCYSFHGTKNYISGEGGAITLNTSDRDIIKKAEIIRQKGTNRLEFLRGEVDKYSWVDIGSSYGPSDILMAILYAQIECMDEIKAKRRLVNDFYSENLNKYVKDGIIKSITYIPKECDSNYHLYYLVFHDEKNRNKFIDKLNEKGISAVIHFVPLHSSSMGRKLGYKPDDLPITEGTSRCLVRLPMYTNMAKDEMDYVIETIDDIFKEF